MISNQTTLEFAGNLTFYFNQPKEIRKWITPYDWDFMKVDLVDEFVLHAELVDNFDQKKELENVD